MKISSFRYVAPEAFVSMKRNSWMTIVAILTVAITLGLCGMFWLLVVNIDANASMMESTVEIRAFVTDGATEAEVDGIRSMIEAVDGVASVTYVSKEEGLASMANQFGEESRITAALDDNPLPDAFTIKATTPDDVAKISQTIEGFDYIQAVRYGQGSVDKLLVLLKWVRGIGLGIMLLMSISAVVLIAMNIRMTVIARKAEIQVMKFVGASNGFIRWPFVLEGIIIGLLGALVALAAIYFSYQKLVEYMSSALMFLIYLDINDIILPIGAGMLGIGLVLGILGSISSLRKFLRV